jgi:hypothetical protein
MGILTLYLLIRHLGVWDLLPANRGTPIGSNQLDGITHTYQIQLEDLKKAAGDWNLVLVNGPIN